MKRSSINGGGGDGDVGGGGSSGNDDESFGSHDSDNYSTAPGGEHSSDEDALQYKGSPVDDEQDKSVFYAAKRRSLLENSDDGSYDSDSSVNHETNVDDEDQIDERKPVATVKKIFTNRGEMLEHEEQIDEMKPTANATKNYSQTEGKRWSTNRKLTKGSLL